MYILFFSGCSFANNRITGISPFLCDDDDEFMDGLVGNLTANKCDAILCPPGTYTSVGRETSPTDECQVCAGGEDAAPFYGSTECMAVSQEKAILEELHGLIFTSKSIIPAMAVLSINLGLTSLVTFYVHVFNSRI